ncbi:MAG: hypothetical protein FJZ47_06085 [Candidatus Tectomicrobia bacterium]|uniref:Cytochrome c domain-containing protein n=1 Tax=Tectimicrobiota bacterium TaxID=2528274 RepID=A0A937VYL2_UNCTE|nr:hypothetical protein [Candidatus Tectomicrobia bacterium]
MNTRVRGTRTVLLTMLMCLSLQGQEPARAADSPQPQPLQPTMQAFFHALTTAFPWSLDAQQFQDPAQRPRILEALRALASNAAGLSSHGQDVPQSFDFLRRSLARNAEDAAQRYAQGEYRSARFALQQLTDNCFACHSRFTNPTAFNLGARFLAATKVKELGLRDQVRLAVATRQFDTALNTCEETLRSTVLTAADIDVMGIFEDYLKLALRVRGDFPRATAALGQFLQRSDVPFYVRERLTSWRVALQELQPQGLTGEALPRARALIQAGQLRNRFPADHQGLIHFVVASSLLHRALSTPPADPASLAELYYLLGITESYISRTSWVTETAFFLETAIRLAPSSPVAMQAYDLLNAYILAEYTGSSGAHVPQELQEQLEELRKLRGGS